MNSKKTVADLASKINTPVEGELNKKKASIYWKRKDVIAGTVTGTIGTVLATTVIAGIVTATKNKTMKLLGIILLIALTIALFAVTSGTIIKILMSKSMSKQDKYWMIPVQVFLFGGQFAQYKYIDSW